MNTLILRVLLATCSLCAPCWVSSAEGQETDSSAVGSRDSVLVVCAEESVNLRAGASWSGTILEVIPTGVEVVALGVVDGEWTSVRHNEKEGWILSARLCPARPKTIPNPAESEAMAYSGSPNIGEQMYISEIRTPLRGAASGKSKVAVWLWSGTKVEILDTTNAWSKVRVQSAVSTGDEEFNSEWYPPSPAVFELSTPVSDRPVGWISNSVLSRRRTDFPDYTTMSEWMDSRRRAKMLEMNKGWSEEIRSKIRDQKIWLGMTSDMALASWGEPSSVNRTVTAVGVTEQWVYALGNYLYFTDGVLTSWQDNERTR